MPIRMLKSNGLPISPTYTHSYSHQWHLQRSTTARSYSTNFPTFGWAMPANLAASREIFVFVIATYEIPACLSSSGPPRTFLRQRLGLEKLSSLFRRLLRKHFVLPRLRSSRSTKRRTNRPFKKHCSFRELPSGLVSRRLRSVKGLLQSSATLSFNVTRTGPISSRKALRRFPAFHMPALQGLGITRADFLHLHFALRVTLPNISLSLG